MRVRRRRVDFIRGRVRRDDVYECSKCSMSNNNNNNNNDDDDSNNEPNVRDVGRSSPVVGHVVRGCMRFVRARVRRRSVPTRQSQRRSAC